MKSPSACVTLDLLSEVPCLRGIARRAKERIALDPKLRVSNTSVGDVTAFQYNA